MGKSGLGDHSVKLGVGGRGPWQQEPQAGQGLTEKGEFLGETE